VLRRRGLELTLVERRPDETCAFAPLDGTATNGPGLAVITSELSAPELALIVIMLGEAALDVAAALRDREPDATAGRRTSYHGIIGAAPPMQELYDLLDRVAPADSTVLIQGENGTGKELVARAVHAMSPRRDRKFVVTNCSAFNDNLLDSELFGHKRGAFTGAVADKPGLFEVADTGTFFLDEIGDMSPIRCCACCKRARSTASAIPTCARSTYASSPRPTATCARWSRAASFARTCSTGSTCCT
jgi:hypothetical protein